ncbi:P-loop NTPase fold protein [Pseudomonas sp. B22129]|uniref:P-loop NTPase fold protein n=1 Tax=Pseudomonas sp. B22129 TaxID=3235111 RepID=UPI0037837DFC
MEHLNQSLDHFFRNDSNVVVIKGDWGVGKTHFWNSYFQDRKRAKFFKQMAYSYVSLFGKNSVDQIQNEIFSCAVKLATDKEINEYVEEVSSEKSNIASYLADLASSNFIKAQQGARNGVNWFGKYFEVAKEVPFVNKFSGLLDRIGSGLISNYVICIDDIERKGKGLKIKELMGLVDELAKRKGCKVVLIFNERSFDDADDLKQFESYREKVVDVELLYKPASEANFNHVFSVGDFGWEAARDVVRAFDITNVRVIKKIKQLYAHHSVLLANASLSVVHEFNVHAAVLAWAYFSVGAHPSCHEIKKRMAGGSWVSLLSSKSDDSTEFKEFAAAAIELKLVDSVLIEPIMKYLEQGYPDDSKLNKCVANLEANELVNRVSSDWNTTWDLFRNSFAEDFEEITCSLKTLLINGLPKSGFGDFLTAIDFLEDVGEDVEDIVDSFIVGNSRDISAGLYGNSHNIRNQKLREAFETVVVEEKVKDIDDVTQRIANSKFWSDEDYTFLKRRTVDEYYSWMKSNPENLNLKIRKGLFLFKGYRTQTDAQRLELNKFLEVVTQALKKVANESTLNAKRVKDLYGVE